MEVGLGLLRRRAASGRFRILAVAALLSGAGAVALMAPYHGNRPNVLVEVLADAVLIDHGDGSFLRVAGTDVLRPGETLRTDAHGRAVLTYADGTTVLVVEGSEFSYVVSETSLGEIIVTMLQSTGRMWYRFSAVLAPGARYELRFPVGAAVVRAGTAFDASVESDGTTTIVTSDGTVEVVAAGVSVPVSSGQQTVVRRGGAPGAPSTATPQPAPTSAPTPTTTATNAPTPSQTASPAPTEQPTPPPPPTPTVSSTPTPTPTPTPTSIPTASLPLPSLLPTPSPTPTATPTTSPTPSPSIVPLPTLSPLATPTLPLP
jgi:hypothetical protein